MAFYLLGVSILANYYYYCQPFIQFQCHSNSVPNPIIVPFCRDNFLSKLSLNAVIVVACWLKMEIRIKWLLCSMLTSVATCVGSGDIPLSNALIYSWNWWLWQAYNMFIGEDAIGRWLVADVVEIRNRIDWNQSSFVVNMIFISRPQLTRQQPNHRQPRLLLTHRHSVLILLLPHLNRIFNIYQLHTYVGLCRITSPDIQGSWGFESSRHR